LSEVISSDFVVVDGRIDFKTSPYI